MSHFDAYRDSFPNARLTRSKTGVLEVALHTDGGTLAFNGYTHEQFVDLFHAIGSDRDNRVVILTGSGNAFMETISPEGFDFFTPRGYDKIYREGPKGPHEYSRHRSTAYRHGKTARRGCTPNISCSPTSCWPLRRLFSKTNRTSNLASYRAMGSICYGRK